MKLVGSLAVSNMVLFDKDNKIKKYKDPREIMEEFYILRMEYYDKRKKALVDKLDEQQRRLSNKERFILMIINDQLKINRRKKKEICKDLRRLQFEAFYPKTKKATATFENADEEETKEEETESHMELGYKYLLSMPIYSLTLEKVQKLQKEREEKEIELDELIKTPIKTMYRRDLVALETALEEHEVQEKRQSEKDRKLMSKANKGAKRRDKKTKKKSSKNEKECFLDKFDPNQIRQEDDETFTDILQQLIGTTKGGGGGSNEGSVSGTACKPSKKTKKGPSKMAMSVEPMNTDFMMDPPTCSDSLMEFPKKPKQKKSLSGQVKKGKSGQAKFMKAAPSCQEGGPCGSRPAGS